MRYPHPAIVFLASLGLAAPLAAIPQTNTVPAPQAGPLTTPEVQNPGYEVHPGEKLDASLLGEGVVESWDEGLRREAAAPPGPPSNPKFRNGRPGYWQVPSRGASHFPHSGTKLVMNKWGDPSLGIGFRGTVELSGVWVSGVRGAEASAPAVRAIGFFGGVEIGRTEWFDDVDDTSDWFAIDLAGIDRVVFEAQPAAGQAGWFNIDDLSFTRLPVGTQLEREEVVLDFEDLPYHHKLTGSGYAGLEWEQGRGFEDGVIHAPRRPVPRDEGPVEEEYGASYAARAATAPALQSDFQALSLGDNGSSYIPSDCHGAVGTTQFCEVVNSVLAVYDKSSGSKLSGQKLSSFLPGSSGDPRVLFDHDSGRWIVMVTNFSNRIYLAVSSSANALGSWFKTNIIISAGADAGRWPDYPTLGVDALGIYTSAYMVGGSGMTLLAIDKAPLLSGSLGTVTAFRNLAWEGAIQPCQTYGTSSYEYLVSVNSTNRIRVRRLAGPLTSPTLTTVGYVTVGTHTDPPNAPALGSSPALNTVDDRLMNACYIDGSIYTAHCVRYNNRAACRWYEINASGPSLVQMGTVGDTSLHYYFPGIAANAAGDIVLGFTGSNSSQYASAYFTGRLSSDPAGEMAPPVLYEAGTGSINHVDGYGRNRWGDYSVSTLDPSDSETLWTIQGVGRNSNKWGTHVAELAFEGSGCDDPTTYCMTSPNSAGPGALISWTGTPSLAADDFNLIASDLPPDQFLMFYYGAGQTQTVFGNGYRCVNAGGVGIFRFKPFKADMFGFAVMKVDYTQPPAGTGGGLGMWLPGDVWNAQAWYRDPAGGGAQFNLSDAVNLTVCP